MPPFTDPIFQYGHSGTVPMGKAITGGVFYNPSVVQFPSSYLGRYFFSDYMTGFIAVLDPAAPGEATEFLSGASGPVDLQVGPDGALYYLAGRGSPGVYRVSSIARANGTASTSGGQSGDSSNNGKCGASGVEPLLLLALLCRLRKGLARLRA
jgi:hypothetical protein